MKKTVFTFLFLLVACIATVKSQIVVSSNGNVGINKTNPSYNLDAKGDFYFAVETDYGDDWGIKIDNSYYVSGPGHAPTLYSTGGPSSLGKSSSYWYKGYITTLYQGSDERYKTNITPIDSALARINKVQTVKYDLAESYFRKYYNTDEFANSPEAKNRLGFLAQQLEPIFPELVNYDNANDNYSVNYLGMVPVLVEALKEQQKQINSLQKIIIEHEKIISSLKNQQEKELTEK